MDALGVIYTVFILNCRSANISRITHLWAVEKLKVQVVAVDQFINLGLLVCVSTIGGGSEFRVAMHPIA